MKRNFSILKPALWYTLILTLVLCSCSSNKDKLLESVPFDANVVATVNLIDLAKQSGLKLENSRIVLPDEYAQYKSQLPDDLLEQAAEWAEAVDMECIVFFGYMNSEEFYATARIKDADKLRSLVKNNGYEAEMKNGTEVYSKSGSSFAFDNSTDQIWFLETRRINKLEEFELARKKNNIMRYSGLADALTDNNIMNLAIDQSALATGLSDKWSTLSVNVSNNAIVAEMTTMAPDGEVVQYDALQPVDNDFLRYFPANFIFAGAVGLNPSTNWVSAVEKAVDGMGSRSDRNAYAEIAPYLKAIDGTVAIGFGPKNKAALLRPMSPDQWQLIAMAHMSQSKVNELIEVMRSNLPGSTQTANGIYAFTSRDLTVNYGAVDGNFAIGMGVELKPDKENSFTADFNGKPMALVFQTPMLNTIIDQPRFAYSIKAKMDYNDGTTRLQINLIGSDAPIVPTLISTLPDFAREFERKARGY